MIRCLTFTLFALSWGLLLLSCPRSTIADPPLVSPRTDSLDLLFINGDKPQRLELQVDIDGRSVTAVWDETFTKLMAFVDRDGNGTLDAAEASPLPPPLAIRSILWRQFTTATGPAPPFMDLDLNADGRVSGEELADYYRRTGLGGVLVGIGKPTATDQLTDALLKQLDTNNDGKVEESEWKAAAETLRKLDSNDDELIGPGELVAKTAYPGALGSILLKAPALDAKPDPTCGSLPFVVLPLRIDDTQWMPALATSQAFAKQQPITPDRLATFRTAAPCAVWHVRLGTKQTGETTLSAVGDKPPVNARLMLSMGNVRLELRGDDGKLRDQTIAARKRLIALQAERDTNSDGTLDEQELGSPKTGQFKQLATMADRDGDGKLSTIEFTGWLDLQQQIASGHVLLTVLDYGTGLFELLDADHDGSLSVRELRTIWERLNAAGCVTDGRLDRTKLPRHLLATVSHGHPRTAIGKPVRRGPDWFMAMDRNGDGDISRREFTGNPEAFGKLDRDQDGFLGAEEAEQAGVR